jgi:DNA-binding response OmpR family regulator
LGTLTKCSPGCDSQKVLAIGDESGSEGPLGGLRTAEELELIEAIGGGAGLRAFYAEQPDVVVLGLHLPDLDGWAVLERIRELSDVPVIVVTGTDSEADRVRGLRAGADDCVATPISRPELLARVEALLRRPRAAAPEPTTLEDEFVHIDHQTHRVEVLGVEVALTPLEFRMLSTFAEHPGRVLAHLQILDMVWGDVSREAGEVKLYVSYLRRKLGEAVRVDPVETVRGIGYRYQPRRFDAPTG